MADLVLVPVDELRPGDKLGQDVVVGYQVLLRSGTELQDGHIKRIQRLGLTEVAVARPSATEPAQAPPRAPAEMAVLPSFRDLAREDEPSWMADEDFSRPVAPPSLGHAEQLFSQVKQTLRRSAGLAPLVDLERDTRVRKEVHAAFISSVLKKEVNLDQLGDAAASLVGAIKDNPGGILVFEDIAQYGQHLAATAVMSGQVFHHARPERSNGELGEHVRCHFAIANAYALLPFGLPSDAEQATADQRARLREALLRYYSWLRAKRFVGERLLELVFLQHERYDGQGLPYGLSGEMVPAESEAWSMATAFSQRLYSTPRRRRLTGREAADHLITQSDRAFSARGVNRLLTAVGYFPTGSMVELNSEHWALVLRQNQGALLRPVVQLVDAGGNAGQMIDLQHAPELFIRRQVLEY